MNSSHFYACFDHFVRFLMAPNFEIGAVWPRSRSDQLSYCWVCGSLKSCQFGHSAPFSFHHLATRVFFKWVILNNRAVCATFFSPFLPVQLSVLTCISHGKARFEEGPGRVDNSRSPSPTFPRRSMLSQKLCRPTRVTATLTHTTSTLIPWEIRKVLEAFLPIFRPFLGFLKAKSVNNSGRIGSLWVPRRVENYSVDISLSAVLFGSSA